MGVWEQVDDLRANWAEDKRWRPEIAPADRARLYAGWQKAVTRTFDWA
jgi:glycerol kinase